MEILYSRAGLETAGNIGLPDNGLLDLADEALLDLVRAGSTEAYAELFERYRYPATRLAAYFSNFVDAQDIVAESFAQVLSQLRRGLGPRDSFRSYLFTAIRHEAGRQARMRKKVAPTDDVATLDSPVPFGNGGCDVFERDLVQAAYRSLPQRWQTVLWHLEVDGRKPIELAPTLGLKANSVSALAYRAREGLRKAYLAQHVVNRDDALAARCHDVRDRLVELVRSSGLPRGAAEIDSHLDTCSRCMGVYLELKGVNAQMGALSSIRLHGVSSLAASHILLLAKSVAGTVGSAAAVAVTTMSIVHSPLPLATEVQTVRALPPAVPPQHEPDRSIGPATISAPVRHRPASSTSTAAPKPPDRQMRQRSPTTRSSAPPSPASPPSTSSTPSKQDSSTTPSPAASRPSTQDSSPLRSPVSPPRATLLKGTTSSVPRVLDNVVDDVEDDVEGSLHKDGPVAQTTGKAVDTATDLIADVGSK